MSRTAGPAAIALAACVQALVREAFPTRPWAQLVARLSTEEREALGGGDNRQLSSRISGQFGVKSRRGPSAMTIRVVLTHCLPFVPAKDHPARCAEVDRRFRAVHGRDAGLSGPLVPPQRRATVGVRQLRDENAVLHVRVAELEEQLETERAVSRSQAARIAALEAELAATALVGGTRPMGILPARPDQSGRPALVRPYAYARNIDGAGVPPAATARGPRHARPDDDEETGPDSAAHAYLIANTPRSYRPLQQYRAEYDAAPAVPLRLPSQKVVGRAAVPHWCKAAPPANAHDG